MKNFTQKWRKATGFSFAFFLIALLFLLVGFGTLGSVRSFGRSYELQSKKTADAKEPCIVFHLTAPKTKNKDGNETDMNVRLSNVYVNLGSVYTTAENAELRIARGYSTTGSYTGNLDAKIKNVSRKAVPDEKKDDKEEAVTTDGAFNWVAPFTLTDSWKGRPSSYPYVKLTARNGNVLINEIVFVAEVYDEDDAGTGKYVVLPAEVDASSVLPSEDALKQARAVVDSQRMPTFAQTSFFRFGEDEIRTLMTVSEIRRGGLYVAGDVYDGDTAHNSLSLCLATLGTLIFGTSPFGLRFFPMLASFGILVVGYFFVRRLFKNEKAALIFSVLYALAGLSLSLAHLGAPVILGLFFLLSSLAVVYRYYENGMKKASAVYALPLAGAGILGALAILCNGVFAVPLAGVVALFIAGAVKEHRKGRALLDKAIEAAEAEELAVAGEEKAEKSENKAETPARQNLRKALGDYRYKTSAAAGVFGCSLLVGAFVLSLLLAIPVSYAFIKLYSTPSSTSMNLFNVAWKAFSNGFTGSAGANYNFFLKIFAGTGSVHAVTIASINPMALLAGLCGVAFAIYRIVTGIKNKLGTDELVRVLVPLIALVLCVVGAAFAAGGTVFVLGAYVFAFVLVGGGAETLAAESGKAQKAVKIASIVSLGLLIALFGLYAVFTFSIPLPEALLAKIL